MFRRRSKDDQAATAVAEAPADRQNRDPQAPKGRPTPKRSEAEAERRGRAKRSVDPRKASKEQRREMARERRAQLAKERAAMATGDERYLPARDKGPVRKLARDFVDTRMSVAEFFLPMAVIILILSMIPSFQSAALLGWAVVIALIVLDSVRTGFSVKRLARKRYPKENLKGVVAYALMRTLQMRRLRMPKPQVKRGDTI
ncbi:hypothetical protein AQ490_18400 [Wenjunlia vitaminophila]|uniref:DUF3043 domain-containing protein n=1 Tax=Wenjunlia vitaminophila TaxID=76728 RepID=A0A0T6LV30_WENVI|nr:DUF3043 domain-containing protein [Wenjunlia vitaminophila]KRV49914.1 hypothetical protein AQ490_18400 [Wenjunlia vitaminophila]